MNNDVKDYYKITDLSANYVQSEETYLADDRMNLTNKLQMWNIRAMFCIAQQLSIVAKHLGKIVGKAEERNGKG